MSITAKINQQALRALNRLRKIDQLAINERTWYLDGIASGLDRNLIWNEDILRAEAENRDADIEMLGGNHPIRDEWITVAKQADSALMPYELEDMHRIDHGFPTEECPQCKEELKGGE